MFCVVLMPVHYSLGTWLDIALFLAFAAVFLRGFNLRLLRLLRLLHPATPHLQNLVTAISAKMRQPVRAVWVSSNTAANAWAFPVTGELVFTSTLLARLSDDEVQAICAHELGHLGESRWVLLGRIVVSLAIFPLIFAFPLMDQFGPFAVVALLAASFLILRLSLPLRRRMEKRADRIAAGFTPDPAIYARALERVYEANRTPAVVPRRAARVHPGLYDRMTASGVTPDFPKPLPAKRFMWTDLLLLLFLVIAGFLAAPVLAS
jgi:Zn-dependent protease with chaperone function